MTEATTAMWGVENADCRPQTGYNMQTADFIGTKRGHANKLFFTFDT